MIRKRISPIVGILYKIRSFTPKHVLMTVFHAHIQSHLTYLAAIYTNASNSTLKPLQVLQNRALKITHRLPPWFSTDELYQRKLKSIIPVKGIGIFQTCTFVKRFLNQEVHSNIVFEKFSSTHVTRNVSKSNFKPTKYRTNIINFPPRTEVLQSIASSYHRN